MRRTFAGIRRTVGTAPTTKAPVVVDHLVTMVEASLSTLRGLRGRALLLLGFAGTFRRSELVSLNVAAGFSSAARRSGGAAEIRVKIGHS